MFLMAVPLVVHNQTKIWTLLLLNNAPSSLRSWMADDSEKGRNKRRGIIFPS